MDVQIPLLVIGRKVFRVMSIHYRTYRVTRLKIITLLSTSFEWEHERYLPEMFRNI